MQYRSPRHPIEPLIAVTDPEMMQLWADSFGVDLDELAQAVRAVGGDPGDVQLELTGITPLRH